MIEDIAVAVYAALANFLDERLDRVADAVEAGVEGAMATWLEEHGGALLIEHLDAEPDDEVEPDEDELEAGEFE